MMRKALSFLGCLLLSIGSVAAEPVNHLSDDYWFIENDASTSTTVDGEQVVTSRTLNAGDTIAYCTLYEARIKEDEEENYRELRFTALNEEDKPSLVDKILDGGYFVKMNVRFTPRGTPQVSAPNGEDFPYRTLIYVKSVQEGDAPVNRLAFLERKKNEIAAEEVLTDKVVTDAIDITVRILSDNTFRVYADGNLVTVDARDTFRSLQTGDGLHYYADSMHSFAFTGKVELTSIEFTKENPYPSTVTSIPFAFDYNRAAISVDSTDIPATSRVVPGATYTISITKDDSLFTFEAPTLTGNFAEFTADSTSDTIKFTVGTDLAHDNTLTLTLPSKAYFFTLNGEKYGSFKEIIAAASKSGEPIKLTHDINLDDAVSPGAQAHIDEGQEVVIDLQGKTIKGLVARPEANDAAILNSGKLKIIDSDPDKKGTVIANGFALATSPTPGAVLDAMALENDNDDSKTTIKAGIFKGLISNRRGKMQIDGGKFYKFYPEDTADNFYLRREAGVTIGARFDNATFETIDGHEFWSGNDSADLIEFRIDEPTYAALGAKTCTKAQYTESFRPEVTAAGYDVTPANIVWTQDADDESIVRGKLAAITYTISYDAKGKDTDPEEPASYTANMDKIALPKLTNRLWDFKGWFVGDKEVKTLGEFATYEGTTEALPEGLIYGDLTLEAKWEAKEIVWTNATKPTRGKVPSEANGLFEHTENTYWTLRLPSGMNGVDEGVSIALKSIAFSTVNASPNNLKRLSPSLTINLDNNVTANASAPDFSAMTSSDELEYFETRLGFRPKIVYAFPEENRPVIRVGSEYTIVFEKTANPMLLRLIRTTDPELQVVGSCEYDPEPEYQFYVPMYEIKGESK